VGSRREAVAGLQAEADGLMQPPITRGPAKIEFGATVQYLPPYSPELNPIEMAWAWVKRLLRKAAPRRAARLKAAIDKYWGTITPSLCQGWIRHCGDATDST